MPHWGEGCRCCGGVRAHVTEKSCFGCPRLPAACTGSVEVRRSASRRRLRSAAAGSFGHSTSAHRSPTIVATHLLKLPSMKVPRDFGIVVRRAALAAKNVDLSPVMTEFNLARYFDESENLVSLGPFFGGDAADECMRSLEKLGLTYIEDFFIFEGFVPEWCSFEVF